MRKFKTFSNVLLFIFIILSIIGCGFHLRGTLQKSKFKKTIVVNENFSNSMTNLISHQLNLNNIKILKDNIKNRVNSMVLFLDNEKKTQKLVSLFDNGKIAEYQLVVNIKAHILISKNISFPIMSTVYYTFLNHFSTVLKKDAEQNKIMEEIEQNLAEDLVQKLIKYINLIP